jgi:type VII secretion-associated serine protease mycosin
MNSRAARAPWVALIALTLATPLSGSASADEDRRNQWHLNYLKVSEAHKLTQGEGIIVAVIDTGIDVHPDLERNLLVGIDVNAGDNKEGRADEDGHGTAMAGLIAAHGSSSHSGMLGIAPRSKLLPVRYKIRDGEGDPDNVARGIEWALSAGAQVICISASGTSSPQLRKAIDLATRSDVVITAAAGNNPPDRTIGFPAAIDDVVAVGASSKDGTLASLSVTGPTLDIVAPGVEMHSTALGGAYLNGNGTSNSAAIVAGAAALVRSRFPELSAEEVVHRLTYTAVDKGPPGRDDEYGHGVLDLVAALTADVPPLGNSATPSVTPPSSPADSAQPREESGGRGVGSVLASLAGFSLAVGLLVLGYRRHRRRNPR